MCDADALIGKLLEARNTTKRDKKVSLTENEVRGLCQAARDIIINQPVRTRSLLSTARTTTDVLCYHRRSWSLRRRLRSLETYMDSIQICFAFSRHVATLQLPTIFSLGAARHDRPLHSHPHPHPPTFSPSLCRQSLRALDGARVVGRFASCGPK